MNSKLSVLSVTMMSSIEIAEMTGKQLSHIHRDIKVQLIEILHDIDIKSNPNLDGIDIKGIFLNKRVDNGQIKSIDLDKEYSLTLVSGYNVKMRNAIIKRWQELENKLIPQATLYLPPQTIAERLIDISTSIDILDRLNMLDGRDRLHYADSVRNAGMALVPQSTEVLPVTISSRVVELHKKANAGQLQKIGKLVVKMYKDIFDCEPLKHTQYVQGAARLVNSYTTEHLDIIDSAINDILG